MGTAPPSLTEGRAQSHLEVRSVTRLVVDASWSSGPFGFLGVVLVSSQPGEWAEEQASQQRESQEVAEWLSLT